MEKPLEVAWIDLQGGRVGVSGSHQGRASGVKLVETQIWLMTLHAGWAREGLNKRVMASAITSVWEKAATQPSPSCQTIQFLHICSHNFRVAPHCQRSEQVSLSVSRSGCGPFERNI